MDRCQVPNRMRCSNDKNQQGYEGHHIRRHSILVEFIENYVKPAPDTIRHLASSGLTFRLRTIVVWQRCQQFYLLVPLAFQDPGQRAAPLGLQHNGVITGVVSEERKSAGLGTGGQYV